VFKKNFTFSIAILLTYISAYGFKKYWYRNENKIFTINDKKKTIYVKSSDYYMSILVRAENVEAMITYLYSFLGMQMFFTDFNEKTLFILDLSNLKPDVEREIIDTSQLYNKFFYNKYKLKNMLNIAFIRDKSIRMRLTNKIGIMNQSGVFMQNPDKILSGDWTALYDAGILHHIFHSLKPSEVQ
jgi:hypothetical protein